MLTFAKIFRTRTLTAVRSIALNPFQGGKSGQHRAPYYLTGRRKPVKTGFLQKVPQKITALNLFQGKGENAR